MAGSCKTEGNRLQSYSDRGDLWTYLLLALMGVKEKNPHIS